MKTLLVALAFLLAPALAHASPITFGFTGNGSIVLTHESVSFAGYYFAGYYTDAMPELFPRYALGAIMLDLRDIRIRVIIR
jgi:hypothetical protein